MESISVESLLKNDSAFKEELEKWIANYIETKKEEKNSLKLNKNFPLVRFVSLEESTDRRETLLKSFGC